MSKKDDAPKTAAETLEGVLTFVRRSFMFWKRSSVVFLLVALASIPGVFLKARIYKSETVVQYQETIKSTDLTGGEGSGENARRVGARLKEMLLSRASLEPIVADLPRYAALADRRGMQDAVDELRGHISFKAREGDTFEIGFEGLSPKEVQDVTRRLGERIVQEAASRRAEQGKATKEYLEAQSDQNKAKLRVADGNLSSFLTLHPEFLPLTLPGGGGKGLAVALPPSGAAMPPGTKDRVLFQMEAEARNIERQLRAGSGGASAPAPVAAPAEGPEVVAARKDLAEKRAQFTDQHPDVVAARRRLALAIEADKKAAVPPPPSAPPTGRLSEADKEALEQRLATLHRSITARRAGLPPPGAIAPAPAPDGSSPAAVPGSPAVALEVEFRRLQREVEYLKDAQRQLDDKLFKADLNAGANTNDRNIQVSILDAAYLPVHPISKPRSTALATFLAAGLILAAVVALISARLDDRIYQRGDLEMLDILPVIGVIPRAAPAGRRRDTG